MTKQDFIQYLSHPEELNGQSIAPLEKLVLEYPYFQIGRMLYLKNLHNENNIDYGKNIHITSAYAPNGKVLYNLIKKKAVRNDSSLKEVPSEFVEIKNEEVTEIQEIIHSQLTPASKEIINEKEVFPKLEPIAVLQEVLITEEKDLSGIKEERQDISGEMQVLEKQMLREAYRTSMTVDLLEGKESRYKLHIQNEKPLSFTHHLTVSKSYSFRHWLKIVNEKTPSLILPAPNTSEELSVPKKSKDEILNSFLLEETARSTPKPKAVFYSADTMAKKSLQDDENFVSETLAKIYLKQGNLQKALRAYEILLVKHPEKVHIFAPFLEKIKNLLKEQKGK